MKTDLLLHNKIAYQKVVKAFEISDRTCVVHPTGTGKSYLIAAVSESYKKVLILGPNIFVLDQVADLLKWRKRGMEYMTYQTLNLTENPHTDYDLICLDEFHRAGAPEWGDAVDCLLNLNKHAKVLGTTATHIRYLDNKRDMADELFHGNIASYMTIADAWNRNILPIPRYVSGLFRWEKTSSEVEDRILRSRSLSKDEKRKRIFRLNNARLHWELSYGMPTILKKHLDKDARRVIIFCAHIEALEQMRDEVIGWFCGAGFTVASSCIIHSGLTDREQHEQMKQFESDKAGGVKLMFSVNMLNEGIHIPNVNAVLMLRTTSSRIIYMQQMGRCLTAANTAKPLVLDMVDNITTTTAIKGIADEFDALEIQQAEHEGREPRKFEVKDYTLGVRDLIEKLVQDTYTIDERLQILNAYIEQYDRLPKSSEADYKHWAYLCKFARSHPHVQELIQRFRRFMTIDDMRQHIRTFAEQNDRWPKRYIKSYTPSKEERSLSRYFDTYRDELLKDDDFRRLYEYYRDKDKPVFEERFAIVKAFCRKYDRFPHDYTMRKAEGDSMEEEKKALACWQWLRKNYADDERVIALQKEYNRNSLRDAEIVRRVELCTAFIKENQRQPNSFYKDEVQLQGYMNSLRQQPYFEREDVQELFRLADSVKHVAEDADELLEEYIRFCETNKKIPSKHSKNAYEVELYKRVEHRKTIKANPRYIEVREKYKKVRMSQEDERRIVTEHCEQTGRRPSRKTSSAEVFRAWQNIKLYNKELAREIQDKYPAVIVWSEEDTERYTVQMMDFIKKHNRRPNKRLDENRLCNILGTLLKSKGDHPAVIRLKEVLNQLPPPVYSPKYYNKEQGTLRSHANRNGYMVVKDRGENSDTRYIIFYNDDTKRNERYETACIKAGLEIKEWKEQTFNKQ
jgi:superfamily II DNA or RNA helicase